MADGTQAWWALADACQGASDRLLTWSGHQLSDGMHEARTCLKLTVTSAAPTSKRAASVVNLHP